MLKNMSAENLARLFAKLIHPDTQMTPALRTLADHVLNES